MLTYAPWKNTMSAKPHGIFSAVFQFRSPFLTRELTRIRKKESFGLQGSSLGTNYACTDAYYNSSCCLRAKVCLIQSQNILYILEILNLSLFWLSHRYFLCSHWSMVTNPHQRLSHVNSLSRFLLACVATQTRFLRTGCHTMSWATDINRKWRLLLFDAYFTFFIKKSSCEC